MDLINFMAQSCHYAQAHLASDTDPDVDIEYLLQCTSYQIACFLAQNTVRGQDGVDSDVVIEALSVPGVRSIEEWKLILRSRIIDLGGIIEGPVTPAVQVHGSHGTLEVDPVTGKVVGGAFDAEYEHIVKFNLPPNPEEAYDILHLGYWGKDGSYEYPVSTYDDDPEQEKSWIFEVMCGNTLDGYHKWRAENRPDRKGE